MKSFSFLLFFCLALLLNLSAQDFGQRFKALTQDRDGSDLFGASISLQGDEFLAGAPGEDHNTFGANAIPGAGSAYAFQRDGQGGWQQTQKFVASDRSASSQFGYSVAMDGTHALIGAPFEALGLTGDSTLEDAGAVYAFQKDSNGVWQETQKLTASDRAAFDWFGEKIVMKDGIALVTARGRDNALPGGDEDKRTGAVYAFERDNMGFWQETQILAIVDTGTTEQFGNSIVLEGDLVLIGAPGETEDENGQNTQYRAGAAYLWQRQSSGQWILHQKLVSHIRQNDAIEFGASVAMEDSSIVILQIEDYYDDLYYQYFRPNAAGIWEYETSLPIGVNPSRHVRLLMKDSLLLMSNPQWNQRQGRARRFRMNPQGNWLDQGYMYPQDGRRKDEFGFDMAIDDTVILIGAKGKVDINPVYDAAGAVYVFETCTPDFPEQSASICTGDSLWFEGDFFSEPGIYEALYQNEEGCDSLITLTLEVYPVVDTSIMQSPGQLMALATDASFQWLQCDSMGLTVILGETNALFTPSQSGEYALAVTNAQGCTDTSACLNFGPPLASQPAWATDLTLFPNPSTGTVQLLFSQPQSRLQIRILDLQGRTISAVHSANDAVVSLELPGPAGLYLIEIQDRQGQRVYRKVVKQ